MGDAPKVEDKKPEKSKKMFHAKIQKTFSRRATTPDIGLGKDSLNLFQRTKSLIARNKAENAWEIIYLKLPFWQQLDDVQ